MPGYLGYFGGKAILELPTSAPAPPGQHRLAAVVMSGDMGFNVGMAPEIARGLNGRGIPVVGVNSLTWFRHRRTPAEMVDLVNIVTRQALAFGHADRVILIGQSFGADTLGVGLTGLAAELRPKVQLVALVVPSDTVFYRASPAELLNWVEPDSTALPTASLLDWVPTVCIHGAEETHSLCPLLTQANVRQLALPGGHMLNFDVGALNAALRNAIEQGDAAPGPSIAKVSASAQQPAMPTRAVLARRQWQTRNFA